MFPDKDTREHLRFCLLQVMKSSQIFGNTEDAKRCTMFYGRILCKTLFPEGAEPDSEPKFPFKSFYHLINIGFLFIMF